MDKKEIEKAKAYILSKNFKDTEYMVNFIAEQMAEYHLSKPKEEPKKEVEYKYEVPDNFGKDVKVFYKKRDKEVDLQKPVESEWLTSKQDFEEFFFIIKDLRLNDIETEHKIKSIYNISKKK